MKPMNAVINSLGLSFCIIIIAMSTLEETAYNATNEQALLKE